MTDMNIDWARELLREAAAIYLTHVCGGGDMDALADRYVAAGDMAIHRHINAVDYELAGAWPELPDLDGVDLFPLLTVARMTDADVFDLARAELARARAKYPAWPADLVHAAAIASEESGEVVKACNSYVWQQGDETPADIRKEAVQAIAMFVRLLTESEVLRG